MPVNWISERYKQTILGTDGNYNNSNKCVKKNLLQSGRKMSEKSPVATIQYHTFAVKYIGYICERFIYIII